MWIPKFRGRPLAVIAVSVVAVLMGGPAHAARQSEIRDSVHVLGATVSSASNIWQVPPVTAEGGDGIAPDPVSLPWGTSRVVTFPSVLGQWSFGGDLYDADGCIRGATWDCGPGIHLITPTNRFSGFEDNGPRAGYLVGVFGNENATPQRTPRSLDFTNHYDFRNLRPRLNQVFFVGDGRDSRANLQAFRVPHGATRLYLSRIDQCGAPAPASCYWDNWGEIDVTIKVTSWGGRPTDTPQLP